MISLELTSRCQLLAIGETIDFKKNPTVNPMMAPIHSNENCSPEMFSSFWVYFLFMRPTEYTQLSFSFWPC